MVARDAILGKIRKRLEGRPGRADMAAIAERLEQHRPNLVPARGQVPLDRRIALFEEATQALSGTSDRVGDVSEVPAAVARYLRQQNLPLQVRQAPDPRLDAVPWSQEPLLQVGRGVARPEDQVSVTAVEAAVAETATLVMTSAPETPTSLNFLPETHIAVLRTSQLHGTYEEVFDDLRERFGPGVLPRSLNFITGPSRTGDIEQTLELGAHGPRRLHILLVEDAPENEGQ
ncbi:MAG: LUD domain-containing protein [Kiloniellales bacterium]